ncbi:MAG TPA: DUF6178 family protein [Geomonas sp.]|nr:DUF6178 family protein [Geomonas sp.]
MSIAEKNDNTLEILSPRAFQSLSLAEKRNYLRQRPAKEKMDLLIADPDGKRVTASLEPQEFFWLMKEVGENDALELLQLASAEQCVFIMDMELWEGWSFSQEKACHWLAHFMEGGEPRVHELLKHLDHEFLQLFLSRELVVGGGIGDQSNDEERLAEYDHTFDGVFMLTFKDPKHSQLIGSFVSMLMKLDNELYTTLMEGIKGDVDVEMEEQCLRFRTGRLEDLGFPPLEEAVSIYARVNPESFELLGGKELAPAGDGGSLVPIQQREETLLFRALALADSPTLLQELNYLVNSALVAEGNALKEPESMVGILDRVCGYLNIALEKLTAGDEQQAAALVKGEPLKRLFQLGFSIVLELQFTARDLQSADYASGKLIGGLKAKRPRYYRGLDADGIDGYREFKDMADVERTAGMLQHFQG